MHLTSINLNSSEKILTLEASFPVSQSVGQLALKFHWVKTYWQCQHTNYTEITQSIMPKPVFLMTVQEAPKEYISLMDQIRAKYEPWTQASMGHPSIQCWSLWIGKSTCLCESNLPETEPATSKGIIQAHILQALKTLFGSKFKH